MSTSTICPRGGIPLSITSTVVLSRLYVPGQIVNKLVEGEDAEADFIVGCFGATLKQAGEGHGGRCTYRGGQLQVGEVGVGAGALVDHPGAPPTVGITGKQAEEHAQIPAPSGPRWVGVHHPGGGEEIWIIGCGGAGGNRGGGT